MILDFANWYDVPILEMSLAVLMASMEPRSLLSTNDRDALKRCAVQFFGFCANDGLAAAIVLATESFGAILSAALPPLSTYHAVNEDAR